MGIMNIELQQKLANLQVEYITGKLTLPELIKKAHALGYIEAYVLSDGHKNYMLQMQALGARR